MRAIIKGFVVSIALFASVNVWSASAWTEIGRVSNVHTLSSRAFVQLKDVPRVNPSGCAASWHYQLDSAHPFFKEQYQSLLTAVAAGVRVKLKVGGCMGHYIKIIEVRIYSS
jgi:hypothetical protein